MKERALISLSAVLVLVWGLTPLSVVSAQTMNRQPIATKGSRGNSWSAEAAQEPQTGSHHNAWLQGDEQQQKQLMGCYRLSADIEQRARDVYASLSKKPVDWQGVRNHYADIKKGCEFLIAKHEGFVSELNNGQRSWWDNRLREIMAVEFKLYARMGAIEGELKEPSPMHAGMTNLFHDLWRLFREWKDYYGLMGADMDIQNMNQKSTGAIRGLTGTQNPEQ